MNKINDGGPAFPLPCSNLFHNTADGMTLRDWFAGQAIMGLLARVHPTNTSAKEVYGIADAMIKEREKK